MIGKRLTNPSIARWIAIALLSEGCTASSPATDAADAPRIGTGADAGDAWSRPDVAEDSGGTRDTGWAEARTWDGQPAPGDGPAAVACGPGTAPLRRLTAAEYRLVIKDLTGLGTLVAMLPADQPEAGFEGFAASQVVSQLQVEMYDRAAQEVASHVGANLGLFLPCDPQVTPEASCTGMLLDTFGKNAFRRPLTNDERGRYTGLFTTLRASLAFREAVEQTVRALLGSPYFLYRPELGRVRPAAGLAWVPLTDHEVATRLSFLLWGRGPDAALLAAADAGQLGNAKDVAAQARRMLADSRARYGIGEFFRQWLQLDRVALIQKSAAVFPTFTPTLRTAIAREPALFVEHVVFDAEGTLKALLGAPYTFVNSELAKLYGVAAPAASGWARAPLDPKQRAGLLTQPWFLATNASATQTSPTRRGAAFRARFLCQDVPPPPAVAPSLDPPPMSTETLRERLTTATAAPACRACHDLIDPLGFPFESYDATGGLRATDNGHPVDTSSLISGAGEVDGQVRDAVDLITKLASSAGAASCLARRVYEDAAGRVATAEDRCRLEELGQGFAAAGGNLVAWLPLLTERQEFTARPSAGLAPAPAAIVLAAAAAAGPPALASKAVIDVVRTDLTTLAARFVGTDARKLQQHLDALREIERRLPQI